MIMRFIFAVLNSACYSVTFHCMALNQFIIITVVVYINEVGSRNSWLQYNVCWFI